MISGPGPVRGRIARRNRIRLRAAAFLLSLTVLAPVLMSVPAGIVSAASVTVPTDASMMNQVSTIYNRALAFDKSHYHYAGNSFAGKCAHYVHIQLIMNGVNSGYVGGNGKDEFDNYKDLSYSTGGRKIHAYPATKYSILTALKAISASCSVATNILVGYESTMTSTGKIYGHAMLIHAVIGNYVYFTDNFSTRFGGVSYTIGTGIRCTIDEFNAFYGRPSVFTFEGMIWFEDTKLTAAVNPDAPSDPGTPDDPGAAAPDTPPAAPSTLTPGEYAVTYSGGLRIRAGASTSYETLYILPYRYTVNVTEISSGFGRIFVSIEGVDYDGWISLTYAERTGDLPAVSIEVTDASGKRLSQQWHKSLDEALDNLPSVSTVRLYADCTLDAPHTLPSGTTLDAGGRSITLGKDGLLEVRGGKVIADAAVACVAADPFVTAGTENGRTAYTCDREITVTSASLVIGNNVALRFKASADIPALGGGASYKLYCGNLAGSDRVYTADSVENGTLQFTTDGIPAKFMGDRVSSRVEISAVSGGRTYTLKSGEMSYSAVEYVGTVYGKNQSLDSMLASMLNYSAAAQLYFGYSPDRLANRVLPAVAQQISVNPDAVSGALPAPVLASETSAHIKGVLLVLQDTVTVRLRVEGMTDGLKLLVFTDSEYRALKAEAQSSGRQLSELMTLSHCTTVLEPSADGSFSLSGITAKKFADTYYFRLAESSGDTVKYDNAFSYSVTEYCSYMLGNGTEDPIDDLCRALCNYSSAARTYFGYTVNSD